MKKRSGRGGRRCSKGVAREEAAGGAPRALLLGSKSPPGGERNLRVGVLSSFPSCARPQKTSNNLGFAREGGRGKGEGSGDAGGGDAGGGDGSNGRQIRARATVDESESSTCSTHAPPRAVKSMDLFLASLLEEGVQCISYYGSTDSGDSADVEVTGQSSPLSVNEHVPNPVFVEPSIGQFSPGSSESLRDEVRSGSRGRKKKRPTPKTERTLWDPEEDELLVSAWLNVSQDPIIGKDQSYDTYWERIVLYYNRHRTPRMKELR